MTSTTHEAVSSTERAFDLPAFVGIVKQFRRLDRARPFGAGMSHELATNRLIRDPDDDNDADDSDQDDDDYDEWDDDNGGL